MRIGGDTIRCITFDLDDTLWHCAPVIHSAEFVFYTWLEREFPPIAAAYDMDALTGHRRALFSAYPEKSHDFSWLRKRWLTSLVDEFTVDGRLVDEGFRVYHEARNDVTLFPGALDVLKTVAGRYTAGSITNGNADVAMVGIDQWFDFAVTAADAGASKPSPMIFEAAIAAADCDAGKILHIGDDPERDIRGAAAAGMKTLWINPQCDEWNGDDPPNLELQRIAELTGLLDQQN